MSRIFEGLQRCDTERSGRPLPESITELLDSAETLQFETEISGELSAEPLSVTELSHGAESTTNRLEQFRSARPSFSSDSRLVCMTSLASPGAEKFRVLAVRMRHLQQTRRVKKILITSTLPDEGKTLIAANLALTLARRRLQNVLLFEGDLRTPRLAQQFGLSRLSGLSELLQHKEPLAASIYHLEGTGLWFLPAGVVPEDPLELMQSGLLSELVDNLASLFDWILVDSPPLIGLADTSLLTRVVDGVLLVAREAKTEKRALAKGLEMLNSSSLLGVVLNYCSADHK